MKAVGLAELLQQSVDYAHRFREAATAREIEMDEDMLQGLYKGPAQRLSGI